MSTLAVDEDQSQVWRQATQIGWTHERRRVADGVLVDVIGRYSRRQQGIHVPDAIGPEVFALKDVYRNHRILSRAAYHAGADHLEFAEFYDLFLLFRCLVRRPAPADSSLELRLPVHLLRPRAPPIPQIAIAWSPYPAPYMYV